jgi:hypothetical protein
VIVICAQSPWAPSIAREHRLARSAAADGEEVVFVEGPRDVRAWATPAGRRAWLAGARQRSSEPWPGVRVIEQSTLVPGQRSSLAQRADAWRLVRALRGLPAAGRVVVATRPWQWPAVRAVPAERRVYECGDDWPALIPGRAAAIAELERQITGEADAIVLVSDTLAARFGPGRVSVVPNGVDSDLLAAPAAPADGARLVYTGTLSERVDADFLGRVMERLPDWELELYGPCQYAGRGAEPGADLARLLAGHGGRVRWCGAVERAGLPSVLDRGRVLVAAHRAALVRGQDSMKLYDYASRRRPIVSTPGALGPPELVRGAGVVEAATPEAFAEAVRRAGTGAGAAVAPEWLERHRWSTRWRAWRADVLGEGRA